MEVFFTADTDEFIVQVTCSEEIYLALIANGNQGQSERRGYIASMQVAGRKIEMVEHFPYLPFIYYLLSYHGMEMPLRM